MPYLFEHQRQKCTFGHAPSEDSACVFAQYDDNNNNNNNVFIKRG